MEKEEKTFQYSYSASQQAEIKKIREKYEPEKKTPKEDKMEQLRHLDESATKPGMIVSIIVGIVGTLLLGVGMSCTMVWAEKWFVPGIIIGVVGLIGLSMALPVYNYITKKQREKLAPEILKLTDELMK